MGQTDGGRSKRQHAEAFTECANASMFAGPAEAVFQAPLVSSAWQVVLLLPDVSISLWRTRRIRTSLLEERLAASLLFLFITLSFLPPSRLKTDSSSVVFVLSGV